MEDTSRWSVDKRVPIASLIGGFVAILTQTAIVAWAVSTLWSRVTTIEDFIKASQPQSGQILVLQEQVRNMQATVERMDSWLRTNVRPTNLPSQNR